MTSTLALTLGEIVTADFRAAAIFERYGLDFCCRGGRTLEQSCRDAGLRTEDVLDELEAIQASPSIDTPAFNTWELPTLVDHIVTQHHAYVRDALPVLLANSRKIANVHGGRHPELIRVAQLVEQVAAEMTSHMMKEEHVLFPYIVALASAAAAGKAAPLAPFGTVDNPIRMMEAEHESAGEAMFEIRELTDGYQAPADGCTTYAVCLQELDAFEKDLHAHVHLENNILFPKASALEHVQ
jgi:regulator of cell morphogenesis and NO signaling